MAEEAVLGPLLCARGPRAVWPLPRERVAGAGDGRARSSWAAAGLRNKRAGGGQVTHGEDWREAEAWPELGVEGTGQCEGQWVPSLPSWPPPPPQPFQGSQRSARKTRQRGAGPKACTRVAGRGRLPGDGFGQQQKTPQRSGRLTRGTPGVPTCPLRAGPRFQTAERDFSTWPSGTWTPVRAQGRGSPRGDRTRVCVVHACRVSV